ncbi:peptidase [marine bacterium AO1-C]|nr:peptidase [marine bacterium AO1-C]
MKTLIGRKDKADFPELLLTNINVKINTGAYTSSIHCNDFQELEEDGETYVEFCLLNPTNPKHSGQRIKTKHFEKKVIKNAQGELEESLILKTIVVIFGQEHLIDLALRTPTDSKYPVSLGRKFLSNRFMVDTSERDLSFKRKQNYRSRKRY